MKTIIIALVMAVIVGGIAYGAINRPVSYEKEVKVETVEVEVETLQKRISDAQEASKGDIEAKAQEAYDKAVSQALLEIELEVTAAYRAEIEAREAELQKQSVSYWTVRENVVALVKAKAEEYGVSSKVMLAVINCESQYVVDVQSRHRYTPTNVPKGYSVGDREQSYGLVQIHLPAHPSISKEQATDPKFAVEFLAKNLKQGRGGMWTCYKDLAMR